MRVRLRFGTFVAYIPHEHVRTRIKPLNAVFGDYFHKCLIRHQAYTWLVVALLSVLGAPSAHALNRLYPRALSRPVFCAGLLNTRDPNQPWRNPFNTLVRVTKDLKIAAGQDPTARFDDGGGALFRTVRFESRLQPEQMSFVKRTLSSDLAFARLARLAADVRETSDEFLWVGYEFRGQEQILNALTAFEASAPALQQRVVDRLTRNAPNTWGKQAVSVATTLAPACALATSQTKVALASLPFCAGVLGYTWAAEPWVRRLHHSVDFRRQYELLHQAAQGQLTADVFNMESDYERVALETQRLLWDLSRDSRPDETQVRLLAEASERMVRAPTAAPEAKGRDLFTDSLVFKDPRGGEPVWLVFVRVYKDIPTQSRRPDPREEENESWDFGFHPGLQPALLPVKVRVRP